MAFPDDYMSAKAILRIEISGAWSAGDLARLLDSLDENYHGLNTVHLFSYLVDKEARNNQEQVKGVRHDRTVQDIWFGVTRYASSKRFIGAETVTPGPSLEALIRLSRNLVPDLSIARISYASPGWIEVLGSWNPLKTISDAVDAWRRQNTIRLKQKQDTDVRQEKNRLDADNERLRIKASILQTILVQAPHLWSGGNTDRIAEVNEKVITPAMKLVDQIGKDSRISQVSAHELVEGDVDRQ